MPMTISHSRRPISINPLTPESDDKDAKYQAFQPHSRIAKNVL